MKTYKYSVGAYKHTSAQIYKYAIQIQTAKHKSTNIQTYKFRPHKHTTNKHTNRNIQAYTHTNSKHTNKQQGNIPTYKHANIQAMYKRTNT